MNDKFHTDKKSNPHLVLITSQYPFGIGEEFLETEIVYLAQYFTINIIPITHKLDVSRLRPVPPNVKVRIDINQYIKSIGSTIYCQFWWYIRHDMRRLGKILSLILNELFHIPLKLVAIRKLIGRVVSSSTIQYALEQNLEPDKSSIFYSYWLSNGATALALWKRNNANLKTIARAHRGDLYAHRAVGNYLPMQEFTIRHLDKIICISQDGSNYLKNLYPKSQSKISVNHLGVREALTLNQPSQDERLRLVTCSYLVPVKRLSLFIEALALCKLPITWTHLGGGELKEMLKSQATHLPKNIHWKITGELSNSDILQFYQQEPVDFFINVSSSEGLPVSIMEAMSYGIPVAATDVGGTRELVHHMHNGFLWDENVTSKDIVSTIEDFYSIPLNEKQILRNNAWQTWHDKVNAYQQYSEFAIWLKTLANQ